MSFLTRDEKLNEVVKGKTVCLAGPAAYLVGSNLGDFIDGHDIVCRASDFTPINYTKDYGRKNDIMFHVFSDLDYECKEFRDFVYSYYSFYDCIQLIVGVTVTQKPYGPFDRNIEELYDLYVEDFEKKPFTTITIENFLKVRKELVDFSSGRVMEHMLLACEIESLFITGFSFYWENEQKPRRHVYYPGKTKCFGKGPWCAFDNFGLLKANHDQKHQKEYFIENILKPNQGRIMIDSFLRDEVLKIDYPNTIMVKWK